MPPIHIKNASIILPDIILRKSFIAINGSAIAAIGRSAPRKNAAPLMIDAKDCYISPGFIDSHIHGDSGAVSSNEVKSGTTSAVLAISCDRAAGIYKKIKNAGRHACLNVLGVRLEGPYINPGKAGAQDKRYIKKPDQKEISGIINKSAPLLRIMTVAPELKGSGRLIKILKKNNIIASIGHSNATYNEAGEGIKAGITHATHLFNAMSGLKGQDPGAAFAALLDDRVSVEIILDLIHVAPELFYITCKVKDKNRIILITDSVRAEAGSGVKKAGGVYRFKDGRIAGSSLTMIKAVENAVKRCGICLTEAVRFAALNPANLLGVGRKKGSIAPGKDADLVIFDKDFDVKMTIINGKIAYRKKGF